MLSPSLLQQNGQTALHLCINAKSLLVTSLLLEHGASIDLADANGATPLSLVVKGGLTLQLQLVLNHHALVSIASRQDFAASVLMDAVDADAAEVVSFLLENQYATVKSRDSSGETAMHRVVVARNLEMMRLVRELDVDGAAIAARTLRGDSCLHYAARYARSREAAFLVDKYCPRTAGHDKGDRDPLDWTNDQGETALLTAGTAPYKPEFERERSATIAALVQAGATLFPPGSLKWRPSKEQDRVLLPSPVNQCLCQWAAKNPAPQVCYEWVASVDWISFGRGQERPLASAGIVTALLNVGFEQEAVRLLALLPLQRSTVDARFLQSLRAFAQEEKSHVLLLQLFDSLAEAWRSDAQAGGAPCK